MISLLELIDTDKVPPNTTTTRQNKNTKDAGSTTDRLSALSLTQITKDTSTSFESKKHQSFIDSLNSHHDNSLHRSTNREISGQPFDHLDSVDTHSDLPSSISNPLQQQQLMQKKERLEQQHSQERGEESNELVELILRCLDKCGENLSLLPLFRDLASDLGDIENNRYTKHIDGRARDILLTGVIGRMIKYLSRFVMICMICDDMQCKLQETNKQNIMVYSPLYFLLSSTIRGRCTISLNASIHTRRLQKRYYALCHSTLKK